MSRRIMIVDDEPEILNVLEEFLTRKGFQVVKCSGGEEALKAVSEEKHIDLIVLDSKMPKVDGPTVIQELKENNCAIPIVMLTGSIDWKTKHAKVKCDGFLIKPINLDELINEINRILK
ncbi:response regulator transcription factor [Candidatus Omnitrophota bacterium]